MKNILIVIGIVLVLGLLILGAEGTKSYVKGGRSVIREEIDDRSPMRLEAARIKALMDSESDKVLEYSDKTYDLESRAEITQRTINGLRKKLESEQRLLERIRGLLAQKQETYMIGANKYTLAEVNADALSRVESCREMQQQIAFHESLLRDLNNAVKQGRTNLAEAQKNLGGLKNKIASLETRNANANLRMEVASLAGSISAQPLGPHSELERAFQNYERRVTSKERRAGAMLADNSSSHLIDYSSSIVLEDAVSEIDEFLQGSSDDQGSLQGEMNKQPPSDALSEDATPTGAAAEETVDTGTH